MAAAYPWTEQDGVWRRKLGSMESFYLMLASPEGEPVHWMIGCCVSIKYCGDDKIDVENALRQAWKDTRPDFPSIAAVVDPGTQEMVVGSDDAAAVEEWLQKSFQVQDGITADELFSAFKSQFSITLYFLRDANALVIQAPHCLIDGRGILYLYHALFTTLSKQSRDHSNGKPKSGPPNLTKPYDDWLGVSALPSEKNVQDAQAIFQRFAQDKPIRLPGVDFGRQPRKAVHRDLRLSEESTRAIVDACKRKGLTVTTAWHAALAMAVQKIQSAAGEDGTSYTQFTTIDLRRWFPAPFSAQQHSVGSLQSALPFGVELGAGSSFALVSESLQRQYRAPFGFAGDDFGFLGPFMAASRQMLASGGVPPSSTPSLSSMGRVDAFLAPRYGPWELRDYWVSSTMLTADFQMYLWTWRARMVLSVCYNDAFYAPADVDAVLERTRDEMVRGLGVQ